MAGLPPLPSGEVARRAGEGHFGRRSRAPQPRPLGRRCSGRVSQWARGDRQTTDGDTTYYTWNAEGLLEGVALPDDSTSEFAYDGDQRRRSKTDSEGVKQYRWDAGRSGRPGLAVVQEADGDGDTTATFTHDQGATIMPGVGTILSVREGAASRFLHTDAQGTTRLATSSAQAQVASFDLDAFGVLRSQTGSFSTPYLFTQKERDAGLDLDYFLARQYRPTTGMFVSRDPLWPREPAYLYVDNAPLTAWDPTGRGSIWDPPTMTEGEWRRGCCGGTVGDTIGGAAQCIPLGGGRVDVTVVNPEYDPRRCVVDCVLAHERLHVVDQEPCCHLYALCLERAAGDPEAALACHLAWVQWAGTDVGEMGFTMSAWWNRAYGECRSYTVSLGCLRARWSAYGCAVALNVRFPESEHEACAAIDAVWRNLMCADDCCMVIAEKAALAHRMREYYRCDTHPQHGWNTWCQF